MCYNENLFKVIKHNFIVIIFFFIMCCVEATKERGRGVIYTSWTVVSFQQELTIVAHISIYYCYSISFQLLLYESHFSCRCIHFVSKFAYHMIHIFFWKIKAIWTGNILISVLYDWIDLGPQLGGLLLGKHCFTGNHVLSRSTKFWYQQIYYYIHILTTVSVEISERNKLWLWKFGVDNTALVFFRCASSRQFLMHCFRHYSWRPPGGRARPGGPGGPFWNKDKCVLSISMKYKSLRYVTL